MAAVAGNPVVISCSTTSGGTYDTVSGIKSANIPLSADALDVTAFDDGVDRTFIMGLRTRTLSFSGTYQPSDTGFAKIKSAAEASPMTSVFIKYLYNGTAGWRGEFYVTKFEVSAAVDGTVDVSCDLQMTGAVTNI